MLRRRRFSFFTGTFVLVLFALILARGEAWAAATPWLEHENSSVRLLSATESNGETGTLRLGLQFKLEPGWKIYWRSPGDAGFPPSLDWAASENLAEAELRWPVPHRFSLFGLETFGYSDEVVLPIEVTLRDAAAPTRLRAELRYLICEEICIPHDGSLTLDLPAGPTQGSRHAFPIDRFASLVPGDGSSVGLAVQDSSLLRRGDTPVLRVVATSTSAFDQPDVMVEGPPGYSYGKPEVTLSEDGLRATLELPTARSPRAEGVLEGKRLTLTVTDGNRGLETEVIGRYDPAAVSALASGQSLLTILGLALLGGLILNLMPCVLPVLSIKLLSVVSQGGRDRRSVRLGFLASAAGILFSFLLLAGAATALKATGMAVGWGIQFQQPWFLAAMAVVVTLFACNLFGLFEIALPGRVSDLASGGGGPNKSGDKSGDKGLGSHFLTGAFATLLATPCSAPFLGTAVGFALARGAAEITLIFAALGLGLALPYLLIAALPGLATRLPRPGNWMVILRRVLGLALLGTALWLLTVLTAQIGMLASALTGLLLAAMALAFLLRRRVARPLGTGVVLATALGALVLPLTSAQAPAGSDAAVAAWQDFDRPAIDRLVAEGQVVFVDVTADWCITCQVNKKLVLDRDPVAGALAADGVTQMRGDWTLPDDGITAYLESFGRYGIPFNAVYGPGRPDGEALPELLSDDAVLQALERAQGG